MVILTIKMVLFGYMEAEQRQWFLGVPGVFSNQEQLMAGIFGFPEFGQNR